MPTLPTWRLASEPMRRVLGIVMLVAVVVASAQIAVLLSRKLGGSLVAFALVPVALVGLYLLLMRREWLLMLILATRAGIDPLLLAMQRESAGMGPGALINALLILLTALYVIQQPRRMARAHLLIWIPFLFIAMMATRNAPDVAKASRVLMVFITYATMFALPTALIRTPQDIRRWLWLLLGSSLIATIGGIGDLLTGGVPSIEPDDYELGDAMASLEQKGFRVQGVFGHPNMYAFYLLTVIALLLYAMRTRLFGTSRTARWGGGAYLAVQLVMLAATQTRSAWAVALFMFMAYGLFIDRRMLILLALAPLAALLVPSIQDRVVDVLSSSGQASDGQLNSYGWRLAMWRSAMPWIREQWLLGWGLDSYTTYSTTFFPLEYLKGYDAHNVYVQLAFETGVPGAVAFAAIFVCLLVISLTFIRERTLEAVLLFALTVGFLMSCYSDNMHRYLTANWYTFFVMSLFVMIGTQRIPAAPTPTSQP